MAVMPRLPALSNCTCPWLTISHSSLLHQVPQLDDTLVNPRRQLFIDRVKLLAETGKSLLPLPYPLSVLHGTAAEIQCWCIPVGWRIGRWRQPSHWSEYHSDQTKTTYTKFDYTSRDQLTLLVASEYGTITVVTFDFHLTSLQCLDAVDWVTGSASGLHARSVQWHQTPRMLGLGLVLCGLVNIPARHHIWMSKTSNTSNCSRPTGSASWRSRFYLLHKLWNLTTWHETMVAFFFKSRLI